MKDNSDQHICVVNCGLPGDQCACYRGQMAKIFNDLSAKQQPLDPELGRVIAEGLADGSLYET